MRKKMTKKSNYSINEYVDRVRACLNWKSLHRAHIIMLTMEQMMRVNQPNYGNFNEKTLTTRYWVKMHRLIIVLKDAHRVRWKYARARIAFSRKMRWWIIYPNGWDVCMQNFLLLHFRTFMCIQSRVFELHACARFTLCSLMEVARLHIHMCTTLCKRPCLHRSRRSKASAFTNYTCVYWNGKSRDAILQRSWSQHIRVSIYDEKKVFFNQRENGHVIRRRSNFVFSFLVWLKVLRKG